MIASQPELLFEEPLSFAPPKPVKVSGEATTLPDWFDAEEYKAYLLRDPDYIAGYPDLEEVGGAIERTFTYLCALNAALDPGVCVVLNSSTGKDSTLMVAMYIMAMKRWREQGMELRKVLVQVSDTNSEFPEMALRMRAEVEALNQYAKAENLPLKAVLVQPQPKHRILVEILGNGKPMPKLSSGQSKNGYNASSWCMDRVKKGVLDKALKLARKEFPRFVQCLGVRNAESAKRSATISKYSIDELPAISRLGDDKDRLGVCPIVHWSDTALRAWLIEAQRNPESECPWRPEGAPELISIYTKGANEAENPTECALVITKDGAVSNSCSDLTGSRMGCWCCLLSTNRSLANTALKDPRYIWLKKCHELIYSHHARNAARAKLRDKSEFKVDTLFPKTLTFEERYRMLVHVFRAELESGFQLLGPDDIDMIKVFWEKHGVFTVTVGEAREDARRWKETGVLEFTYQKNMRFAEVLAKQLGEGIPAGAFFPKNDNLEQLNLAHLVGISSGGFGSPLVPTLLSYVFFDRRKGSSRFVVMVTDVPSVMGCRTNTGLLSDIVGAAWECINIRQPTEWEREMSDGRVFFYASSDEDERRLVAEEWTRHRRPEKAQASLTGLAETKRAVSDLGTDFRATTRYYENTINATLGCPEDPLAESIQLDMDIPKLSQREYEELLVLCGHLAYASDELSSWIQAKSKAAVDEAKMNPNLLEAQDKAGKKYRLAFRKRLVKELDLPSHVKLFRFYAQTLCEIIKRIREGKASCGLVSKCCYLARLDAVDPEEAVREWGEFLKIHLEDEFRPLEA